MLGRKLWSIVLHGHATVGSRGCVWACAFTVVLFVCVGSFLFQAVLYSIVRNGVCLVELLALEFLYGARPPSPIDS